MANVICTTHTSLDHAVVGGSLTWTCWLWKARNMLLLSRIMTRPRLQRVKHPNSSGRGSWLGCSVAAPAVGSHHAELLLRPACRNCRCLSKGDARHAKCSARECGALFLPVCQPTPCANKSSQSPHSKASTRIRSCICDAPGAGQASRWSGGSTAAPQAAVRTWCWARRWCHGRAAGLGRPSPPRSSS